jgi:hypothetical protein
VNNLLNNLKKRWNTHNATIVFSVLLLIFVAYSIFVAINLRPGIIPDEPYRFEVSQYFSETLQIPEDVPIAIEYGDDLQRNPFFGYWIFGRALNIHNLVSPSANERQQLIFLRVFNLLFSVGSVIYTYLLAKEFFQNKWLQLLPVFLLTNTLMFVFLSSGVSYDNPTNFAGAASIYYLVRVVNKKAFMKNSLKWLIAISFGSLIKRTILPLALISGIIWIIFVIRNKPIIPKKHFKNLNIIFLMVILAIFIGFNIYIYGFNLIKFQSLLPKCLDTFSKEVCENSVFNIRYQKLALANKLTVVQAFKQGYPDPIRYVFDVWIREILKRIFGIMGHLNYYPIVISYFHIALYWMIILAARYIRKPSFKICGLFSIFIFYAIVLIYTNYNSELIYGFKQVALQGRYIFPVISAAYILYTFILNNVSNKIIKFATLSATILLFLYAGPIRFIWYYNSVFTDWFI